METAFKHAVRDDILGGEDEYKTAQKIEKACANSACAGTLAVFKQEQTRSADEGSTITYKVCLQRGEEGRVFLLTTGCSALHVETSGGSIRDGTCRGYRPHGMTTERRVEGSKWPGIRLVFTQYSHSM